MIVQCVREPFPFATLPRICSSYSVVRPPLDCVSQVCPSDHLRIHRLSRHETSKSLLKVGVLRFLSFVPLGKDRSPRFDECLVNRLEVHRVASVNFLHCRSRRLIILSDPLCKCLPLLLYASFSFLIPFLILFRHVVLVLFLKFLPTRRHGFFYRWFIHLWAYLFHGFRQPEEAFSHQVFPPG